MFYVTPTEALKNYANNPTKVRFRLGDLVLEGNMVYPVSLPEVEFVITNLISDIMVWYEGSLLDFFKEWHSVMWTGS